MELYIEYKPCKKTIRDRNGNPELGNLSFLPSVIYFKDGKSNCSMFLSRDYKFIYGFYNYEPTLFRVINISSKPIKYKNDKLEYYKRIQKQIEELKCEQRKILKGISK